MHVKGKGKRLPAGPGPAPPKPASGSGPGNGTKGGKPSRKYDPNAKVWVCDCGFPFNPGWVCGKCCAARPAAPTWWVPPTATCGTGKATGKPSAQSAQKQPE